MPDIHLATQIANALPAGSRRAVLAMTDEWQFCGKATFDANGAWNASRKAKDAVERESRKDGKWSRYAYRLTPLGVLARAVLRNAQVDQSPSGSRPERA